jgi:Spy/CpxP family protein refolding chaperone
MKIKILIGVLLVLIVINLGTIGTYLYLQLSRDKNPPWSQTRQRSFPHDQRPEMKLDKQQRQQLRNLLMEFRQENQETRSQIRELERITFDLLQKENVPVSQINQNLKQLSDQRLKLMEAAVEKMIKAKSFLNPEQQKRFFDFIMESRPAIPAGPRSQPGGPQPAAPQPGGPPANDLPGPADYNEIYEME